MNRRTLADAIVEHADWVQQRIGEREHAAAFRLADILEAAGADAAIARSKHVREFVAYLAEVAADRWVEMGTGNGVEALREVIAEHNRVKASKPRRKDVTRAELIAYRDAFVAKRGGERGWRASAQAHFDVGPKVIAKRLAGD